MPKRAKTKGSGAAWIWYVLLLGIALIISPGGSVVMLVGLLPTLVALLVTTGTSVGPRLTTVATFNMAGVVPFAAEVAFGGGELGETLTDVFAWGVMMGAAGIGAGVNYIGPFIASQMLTGMAETEKEKLEAARKKLIHEWGEAVTGNTSKSAEKSAVS